MGNDEIGPAKIEESLFKDFSRGNIQMVGRFVEDEEIRSLQKEFEQSHSRLFPTA